MMAPSRSSSRLEENATTRGYPMIPLQDRTSRPMDCTSAGLRITAGVSPGYVSLLGQHAYRLSRRPRSGPPAMSVGIVNKVQSPVADSTHPRASLLVTDNRGVV